MTLTTFRKNLKDDGFDPDDIDQAVTLAAYEVGPSITRIARFLRVPRHIVAEPARLLRTNGVWRSGKIVLEDPDAESLFGVELVVQVCVAKGLLEIVA